MESKQMFRLIYLTIAFLLFFEGLKGFRQRVGYDGCWKCGSKLRKVSINSLSMSTPYTSVFIVPTGIGAKVGGFAGDALPSAKLLAGAADVLITHPNVMNGAMLYWPIPNVLYVEGYALDEFAANRVALEPISKGGHKIGLLLDKGIEPELIQRHTQVADAMRATLGINIHHVVVTKEAMGVKTMISEATGASWGSLENPETLREAGRKLKAKGCTAIAVVARFPEDQDIDEEASERFSLYRQGLGVDSIAGIEALISHILTKDLMTPVAHAPAFEPAALDAEVSPKACAEEIGYTFLPCILAYLHRAPTIVPLTSPDTPHDDVYNRNTGFVTARDVNSVIVPYNALGGPAVLSFLAHSKSLVIAVLDNQTSMQVEKSSLPSVYQDRIILAHSYAEAAGYVLADKLGILRESITSHVARLGIEYL